MATATATTSSKPKLDPISIALRNAGIFKMHREGNSNQTIAECVGLHPGNVAKIIKRHVESNGHTFSKHPLPLPIPLTKTENRKPAAARKRSGKQSAKSPAKGVRVKRQGMSLLDAAVLVLQRSKTPDMLHPKELVERATSQKLWKEQSGKTPYATLWSRILAEIKLGPRASRFRLMSPGKFGLTACGKAWKVDKPDA